MSSSEKRRNTTPTAGAPAVELLRINKWFGAVHANRDVSLSVAPGTIHGIVGENGAGKSTLMSILYGFHRADRGEIRIAGRPVAIRGSEDAIAAGIGMVHQHFMLVDTFTVVENVILGAEGGRLLAPGTHRARGELAELASEYALEVPPDALVGDLPVGLQQRVEILKALYRGAEILVLDEPTGTLAPQEADHLFRILRRLKGQGKTIVLITHKLREIMAVTDRISVMRQGRMVAHRDTATTTVAEIAELMVGRRVLSQVEKEAVKPGRDLLSVENLRVRDDRGLSSVRNVSFSVRAGEIVGIAGVAGNGQRELSDVIAGLRERTSGTVTLFGRDITGATPRHRFRCGLSYIPEDRVGVGLAPQLSVTDNAILRSYRQHTRGPLIAADRARAFCAHVVESFKVRAGSLDQRIAGLSGGNLQRLLVGRELTAKPSVIVASQPTRGLDVQGVKAIQELLIDARNEGLGVLMVSEDLDELLAISDRIIVMHEGRIAAEFKGADANRAAIGLAMAGESA